MWQDSRLLSSAAAEWLSGSYSRPNVNCAIGAQVYASSNTQAGAVAHEVLSVTRKVEIPGLKVLVARNTGGARWLNIRPPHTKLT